MNRFKPFVLLDILATLPLFIYATRETFRNSGGGMFGLELFVLVCALVVMFPSLVCLAGRRLPHFAALLCLLFYLLLLVLMWFRTMSGWGQPHHVTLVRLAIMLLIAKSIYGICSVTRREV